MILVLREHIGERYLNRRHRGAPPVAAAFFSLLRPLYDIRLGVDELRIWGARLSRASQPGRLSVLAKTPEFGSRSFDICPIASFAISFTGCSSQRSMLSTLGNIQDGGDAMPTGCSTLTHLWCACQRGR
jgi:hypothetical protein